jgi:hypothetical protein
MNHTLSRIMIIGLLTVLCCSLAFAAPHERFPSFSASGDRFSSAQHGMFVDTIVFPTAYYSIDGGAWQQASLSGNAYPGTGGAWLSGSGSFSLPEALSAPGEHYLLFFSCSLITLPQTGNPSWDCHGNLNHPGGFWQLVVIEVDDPVTLCVVGDGLVASFPSGAFDPASFSLSSVLPYSLFPSTGVDEVVMMDGADYRFEVLGGNIQDHSIIVRVSNAPGQTDTKTLKYGDARVMMGVLVYVDAVFFDLSTEKVFSSLRVGLNPQAALLTLRPRYFCDAGFVREHYCVDDGLIEHRYSSSCAHGCSNGLCLPVPPPLPEDDHNDEPDPIDTVGSVTVGVVASAPPNEQSGFFPASNVIDGVNTLESRWSLQSPSSLTFTFSRPITIDAIEMSFYRQSERRYSFKIESFSGSSWTSLLETTSPLSPDLSFIAFSLPEVTTDTIRITGFGSDANEWNSYQEVRFLKGGAVLDIDIDGDFLLCELVSCDDGDPCTTGVCSAGACVFEPVIGCSCVGPDTQSCALPHGQGVQTRQCSGTSWSAWSVCELVSCDDGYVNQGGSCVALGSGNDLLSGFCAPGTFVPQSIVSVPLRSMADYASKVHIDPSYTGGNSDGSIAKPYTSWHQVIPLKANTAYLQKRGTIADINGEIKLGASNILVGAYGSGSKPMVRASSSFSGFRMFSFTSSYGTVRDLYIGPGSHGVSSSYNGLDATNKPSHNMIYNNTFYKTSIVSWSDHLRVLHNDVLYNGGDAVFIQNARFVEVGYNNVLFANQKWHSYNGPESYCPESECSGDAVQFNKVFNYYVHNNVLDRSDTGNKFAFISTESSDTPAIIECNVMTGPAPIGKGGATIYGTGNNAIIRYNTLVGPAPSAIYTHSKPTFHNNRMINNNKLFCSGCTMYANTFE